MASGCRQDVGGFPGPESPQVHQRFDRAVPRPPSGQGEHGPGNVHDPGKIMGQPERQAGFRPVKTGKVTVRIIHGQPGIDLCQPGIDFFLPQVHGLFLDDTSLTV